MRWMRMVIPLGATALVAVPIAQPAGGSGDLLQPITRSTSKSVRYKQPRMLQPMNLHETGSATVPNMPNVVLITVDDMAASDLSWMPYTQRLIGNKGATLTDFVANHPLCAPARAEIITGQYAQNNGVRHNGGTHGGFDALRGGSKLPNWLRQEGYDTAFVGKYINGYHRNDGRETGWDVWNAYVRGIYKAYDMVAWDDGRTRDIHTTDYVGRETQRYIRRFGEEPFFIWSSFVAPHKMVRDGQWYPPLPRRQLRTADPPSMSKPSFNEPDVSDKPDYVQNADPVSEDEVTYEYLMRGRSLKIVDQRVRMIIRSLRRTKMLRDTVIMFTSDNGYLMGEHRLMNKNAPYEEALKVPFLIRGPGIPSGIERDQMATMIDIAPTILDLIDARRQRPSIDGHTMLPMIHDDAPGYGAVLIQAGTRTDDWRFRGVRTPQYTWVKNSDDDFVELYDRREDPYQLDNLGEASPMNENLKARFEQLADCSGSDCWQLDE